MKFRFIQNEEYEIIAYGKTKNELITLIEYVQGIGAMFLVGDMICSPQIEDMLECMKNSKANQYCKNPVEYILSLNEGLADIKRM